MAESKLDKSDVKVSSRSSQSGSPRPESSGAGTARPAGSSSWLRKTVITGALGAVSIVLVLTGVGYIPWFAGASLTVMHVPAIVGGILEGPIVGAIVGAIFGLTALIKAATAPQGPIDVFFTNPLISVVPRILVGIVAWLVFKVLARKNIHVASLVSGVAGSLTNSLFVLGALVVFGAIPFASAVSVFVANGIIESILGAILTWGVVAAWKGIANASGKAKLADEEE
ncbi:MAG TPA: ECF transporter S component [Spirochaetales bacterium]|nr:ECF transporter S component [Spirochaetales bacterium]HPS15263.1 ECF transporter S component [Spirochaetales bacterium]